MHPALKKILCHPLIVQEFVRSVAPELADRIDFKTLETLGPELVGDDLARRFPEMMWIARTRNADAHFLIMLYLEPKNDPMMAVRVATDGRQAVRELLRRMRPPPAIDVLEVLPVVIHVGKDRWTAARSVDELLLRGDAGDHLNGDTRP